jgi:hypothetical protein
MGGGFGFRDWNRAFAEQLKPVRHAGPLRQGEIACLPRFFQRYRGPRSLICHGMLMPIDWEDEALTFGSRSAQ